MMSLVTAIAPRQVRAETLIINPTCGPTGTSVSMTGSGWAEPEPTCRYLFLFDGTSFAPDQEDGLYGPPNSSGTVPGGAALGNHTIRVELRDDTDNHLEGCRMDTFKVVTMSQDPFNGGANVAPGGAAAYGAGNIAVTFNPANACKVTPCSNIVPIQTIQQIGTLAGPVGGTRTLNYTEQGFGPTVWSIHDNDITGAGWSIDGISATSPYYTSGGAGNNGNQSAMPMSAQLIDRPSNGPANYPAGIIAVTFNFEDNFFCAAGENRGEWLGMATWTWTQTLAGAATSTAGTVSMHSTGNQNQPSQTFLDALNLYNTNHGVTMFPTIVPRQLPPGLGGQPCN